MEVIPILPFLKPKAVAGVIISKRTPDGGKMESHSEGNEDQGLIMCAEDLIRAIHAKDAKAVAAALRAADECMDEASPSEDSNDYDSQNEKAAKAAQE